MAEEKTKATLELEGHIYIVERDNDNKIISQEELDGEVVLKCVANVLSDALRDFDVNELSQKNK